MDVAGAAWFASILAFAVAMSATPGPNNAMLAASGALWGFRRTLPHMLGISVGFPAMLAAVAFGAGELLRANPWAQEALRWAGAAYMLWLAWHIAMAKPAVAQDSGRHGPLGFVQAALFQWINPKAWVIAVGAVVTYTTGQGAVLMAQEALLATVFLVVSPLTTALWTMVGVGAARLLRTPRNLRRFNLAMAALLVASLVPMLRGE